MNDRGPQGNDGAGDRPDAFDDRAAGLRRAFDASFAMAPAAEPPPSEDFLAVRIGADAFALRRTEVAGLLPRGACVRLPSDCPEFMGVVGFRGLVVPVYSLRALLGYPQQNGVPWAVLTAGGDRVGLAFDEYEGYLRLAASQVAPRDDAAVTLPHVLEVVRGADAARSILSISSVLDVIKRRVRAGGPSKER